MLTESLNRQERRLDLTVMAWIFCLTVVLLLWARAASPLSVLLADRFLPGSGVLQSLVMGLYACLLGHGLLNAHRTAGIRSAIWALFSLVFFGQLVLGLFGLQRLLMTGELHLPVPALILAGPLYRGHGLFMPILYASTVLVLGPAWCSFLCYIGAWDDKASRLTSGQPRPVPKWATHGLRPAILVLVAGTAVLLGSLDAPAGLAVGLALGFGLAGVAVMLTLSRAFGQMVHCTVVCPIGLISNLIGRISPWQIWIGSGCTRCGQCSRACRYSALQPDDLDRGKPGLTCTLCGDCLGHCPQSEIGYRFPGLKPHQARAAFLVLAVSLHTVFLGVARI
jgi:polyferredoxin